jgi:aryl-alcohol dehydrogenase-like predicted oxidoreductase
VSLGGWVTYGNQVSEDLSMECMNEAYKLGINFFDTAEVYASGKSEEVMGRAIKQYGWSRNSFVISTKIYWGGSGVNDRGLSRKHIIEVSFLKKGHEMVSARFLWWKFELKYIWFSFSLYYRVPVPV